MSDEEKLDWRTTDNPEVLRGFIRAYSVQLASLRDALKAIEAGTSHAAQVYEEPERVCQALNEPLIVVRSRASRPVSHSQGGPEVTEDLKMLPDDVVVMTGPRHKLTSNPTFWLLVHVDSEIQYLSELRYGQALSPTTQEDLK